MSIITWLAAITLLLAILAAFDLLRGNRAIRALRDEAPRPAADMPRVSIVVAARNEERNIREALSSLMALNYPDYELIVVNDRSIDRTGDILDDMAAENPRLKTIHVDSLPSGWLGKNHALWTGSRRASGDLLLFTDADIVMEPTVLTRAVGFLERQGLDHLAATPSMRMQSLSLAMFGTAFIVFFSLFARPWKARDPRSRCHIGIGAFNLVRRNAYQRVGGHETIRLRPDDDIKLGKILKMAGYRQDAAYAPEFLAVEWYASIGETVRGLEKNAFSGADYNVLLILFGVVFHLSCSVIPFIAPFVLDGTPRILYLAAAGVILLTVADCSRHHGARPWHALGYPAMTILFVYILLRTMLLNLIEGGIRWRGTFYPLAELKKNKV